MGNSKILTFFIYFSSVVQYSYTNPSKFRFVLIFFKKLKVKHSLIKVITYSSPLVKDEKLLSLLMVKMQLQSKMKNKETKTFESVFVCIYKMYVMLNCVNFDWTDKLKKKLEKHFLSIKLKMKRLNIFIWLTEKWW